MDLLKTVVESKVQNRESLESSKESLEQNKTYVNQLLENLQEMQIRHCRYTEILEINNMTKNAFNNNSKEVKYLIGLIYKHLRATVENLFSLTQTEQSLEDICYQNTEKLNMLETHLTNQIHIFERRLKNINDQKLQERGELQKELDAFDAEYQRCEVTWEDTLEQYKEKQKELQSIKLQIDITLDNLNKEVQQSEALLQEANHNLFIEANNTVEMNDRILEMEEKILPLMNQKMELSEQKEKMIQKQIEEKLTLESLKNECLNLETMITETEHKNAQHVESITNEIEMKKKLIEENQAWIASFKTEKIEIKNEIEDFKLKLVALDEEIAMLQRNMENSDLDRQKSEITKITAENEQLVKEYEHLENLITECNSEIVKKQQEFDTLKSTPNLELLELEEQFKALEVEKSKNVTAEREIEELELNNKNLKQSVDQYQITIRELSAQKIKIQVEIEEIRKQLENVTKQCDTVEKEIQLLEQQSVTLPPMPVKRRHTALEQSVKQTTQSTKKRGSSKDLETDSEGDRMTYTEFMARKKRTEKKTNVHVSHNLFKN